MKLSEKILTLRKQHGMSQEGLAEKLQVSRQAISRWEMGSAQPDASNLLQLSKLFQVSADYLLNDEYESVRDLPTAPQTAPAPGHRWKKIAGLCISGFGLLGNFIIYIFSRFVPVMIPYNVRYDERGLLVQEFSSSYTAYSYHYFVQTYSLEFLTVLFWILFAAGLLLAFVKKETVKKIFLQLKNFFR